MLHSRRVFSPGRGCRGVTLGMAPLNPHLYRALHPGELLGCGGALWGWLRFGVWEGPSTQPRQEEGWICGSTGGLQVGQSSAVALSTASPRDTSSLGLP